MRKQKTTEGARALLFERLVDLSPYVKEEPQPFRMLGREELLASVRRELGRLLNTRCSVPMHLLGEEERTVINYGLPDFTSLSPQSTADHQLIAGIIEQTVTAFEPRLRQVRVPVDRFEDDERTLCLRIEAQLVIQSIGEITSYPEMGAPTEAVSFRVFISQKTGIAKVYESE